MEHISLFWQIHKRYIKTKNNKTKQKINFYKDTILSDIKELTDEKFENIFEKTIKKLNNIIQSSSAIECINSILRPYLNTCKKKIG